MKNEDIYLRPKYFKEYIGQEDIKEKLNIYIKASLSNNEVLDHILLYGPPGLGKTTLAMIISNELNSNIRIVNGGSINTTSDIVSILSRLSKGDILFIDEIHRIPKNVEEIMYSAMEDFSLDILINTDGNQKCISLKLEKFTLIGATTKYGELTGAFRDRFGVVFKLLYYSELEIDNIIKRTALIYNINISKEASKKLSSICRNTPRIAIKTFKRVRDYSYVLSNGNIDLDFLNKVLLKLGIDDYGLESFDRQYMNVLVNEFNGGPVGIDSLSCALCEEVKTIEEVYEPFLLKIGFISRTKRGRIALKKGIEHIKKIKINES